MSDNANDITVHGYPRYTPEKVTCPSCGKSWSGNQNGLRRHLQFCRQLQAEAPAMDIPEEWVTAGAEALYGAASPVLRQTLNANAIVLDGLARAVLAAVLPLVEAASDEAIADAYLRGTTAGRTP